MSAETKDPQLAEVIVARIGTDKVLQEVAMSDDIEALRTIAARYRRSHIEQRATLAALQATAMPEAKALEKLARLAIMAANAIDHSFDRTWELMKQGEFPERIRNGMAFLGHELAKPSQWLRSDFGLLLSALASTTKEKTPAPADLDLGEMRSQALAMVEDSIDACDDIDRLRVLAKQLARDLILPEAGELAAPAQPSTIGDPS